MLFSDWVQSLSVILEVPQSATPSAAAPTADVNWNQLYPRAIEYVEQRLQTDIDLLTCYVTDNSGSLTPNQRAFTLPTATVTFVVVTQLCAFVGGVRQPPMLPASRDWLDWSYPSETALGVPSVPGFWTPFDTRKVLVGPAPDIAYPIEVLGTARVTPLSFTNTSNWLTTYLPDLYEAASVVWFAGYQRDYGTQSDDPKLAMSWETIYQDRLKKYDLENLRKQFRNVGFSSRQVNPVAQQT